MRKSRWGIAIGSVLGVFLTLALIPSKPPATDPSVVYLAEHISVLQREHLLYTQTDRASDPSQTLPPPPTSYIDPHVVHAPWFDGAVFDPDKFADFFEQRGFTPQQTWWAYTAWDRIGSPVFVRRDAQTEMISDALLWRGAWARSFLQTETPEDLTRWQEDFAAWLGRKQSTLNRDEASVFSEIVGFGSHEWEAIQTHPRDWTQTLSYAGNPITSKRDLHMMLRWRPGADDKLSQRARDQLKSLSSNADDWSLNVSSRFSSPLDERLTQSQQGRMRIGAVVEKHGLLGLKLRANTLQSIDEMEWLSHDLDRYGNALGLRTGLGAGALGLHGRVFWVLAPSTRSLVSAHTRALPSGTRIIHSTWPTMAHEWFHAYTSLWSQSAGSVVVPEKLGDHTRSGSQPGWAYYKLTQRVGYHQLTRTQENILVAQAQTRVQRFATRQWGAAKWDRWRSEFDTGFDAAEFEQNASTRAAFSFSDIPSSYDGAIMTASLAWIKKHEGPKKPWRRKGVSTWVERRVLLDEILSHSLTQEDMGDIAAGYFSKPDEWLAAAFQADFDHYLGKPLDLSATSVMNGPTEIEAQAYSVHWTAFFKTLKPVYLREHVQI